MNKVPVGATIAAAWRFAATRFLAILGILWLPMLLTWAPGFLLRSRIQELSARVAARDFSALPQLWTILLPFYLVVFVLMCMQMVGVAQLALGLRRPSWFYFSLGRPVWRLFGNFLLFVLISVLGGVAAALAGVLVAVAIKMIAGAIAFAPLTATLAFVSALALIGIWLGWITLTVRLSFLMTPVVAAEEPGMALGRAWAMSKGNFWRIFVVLLSFLLPFVGIELALLFGFMLKGVPFPPPHPTVEQQAAFQSAMQAHQRALTSGFYHHWYLTFPLLAAAMVLFYGVGAGIQCFSYRALVSDEIAGG